MKSDRNPASSEELGRKRRVLRLLYLKRGVGKSPVQHQKSFNIEWQPDRWDGLVRSNSLSGVRAGQWQPIEIRIQRMTFEAIVIIKSTPLTHPRYIGLSVGVPKTQARSSSCGALLKLECPESLIGFKTVQANGIMSSGDCPQWMTLISRTNNFRWCIKIEEESSRASFPLNAIQLTKR